MVDYRISSIRSHIDQEEGSRRLALAYALILSWPVPEKIKAESDVVNLSEDSTPDSAHLTPVNTDAY